MLRTIKSMLMNGMFNSMLFVRIIEFWHVIRKVTGF